MLSNKTNVSLFDTKRPIPKPNISEERAKSSIAGLFASINKLGEGGGWGDITPGVVVDQKVMWGDRRSRKEYHMKKILL